VYGRRRGGGRSTSVSPEVARVRHAPPSTQLPCRWPTRGACAERTGAVPMWRHRSAGMSANEPGRLAAADRAVERADAAGPAAPLRDVDRPAVRDRGLDVERSGGTGARIDGEDVHE